MSIPWPVAYIVLAVLSYALLRAARRRVETRRKGRLMKHLDWTRSPPPTRTGPRKRGFLASVFGF